MTENKLSIFLVFYTPQGGTELSDWFSGVRHWCAEQDELSCYMGPSNTSSSDIFSLNLQFFWVKWWFSGRAM